MPKGVYVRGSFSTRSNIKGSIKDVFWKRVDKDGPMSPYGKCWIWIAGKYANGYGQFRNKKAHRVAFELSRGPIAKGYLVLHKCDNPPCVNPSHLKIGTPLDNMQDKMSKGRWKGGTKSPCFGEKNGNYKHGRRMKKR